MFDAYHRSRFSEGGNPLIGRQLPILFEKAGFKDIDIDTTLAHSKLKGDKAMLSAENVNISRSLVREGFLKAETLERLLKKWFEMLQSPDHVIFRQLFLVAGRKDLNAKNIDFNYKALSSSYIEQLKNKEDIVKVSNQKNTSSNYGSAENEEIILNTWKQVLANGQIVKTDNFFEIGGNSVMIPEILQILENKHNIKLNILDFFQYPTVQLLATIVGSDEQNESGSINISNDFSSNDFNISTESQNHFLNKDTTQENTLSKIKAQRDKFKNLRK
jgi:acyl carrier protein